MIKSPVFLEHGTADQIVPHNQHTEVLVKKLKEMGKKVVVKYYENGGHRLEPITTRLEAFKSMITNPAKELKNDKEDDFKKGTTVKIPCGSKTLIIDWSKEITDNNLFRWE